MGALSFGAGLLPAVNSVVGTWRGFENDRRQAENDRRAAAERAERQRLDALERQQAAAEKLQREQLEASERVQREQQQLEAEAARREFDRQRLLAAQDIERRLAEQRQVEEGRTADLKTSTQLDSLRTEAAASETQRLAALRRAVARQRARFGAQGVGSSGGSSEAVLLGIVSESDEDRVERARLDRLRETAMGDELEARRRRNLLELTELAEKQRLEWLSLRV